MVQASLGAQSPCIFVGDTGTYGVTIQWGEQGQQVTNHQEAGNSQAQWVELTYDGTGNFNAYYNTSTSATPPGSGWNQVGGMVNDPMGVD